MFNFEPVSLHADAAFELRPTDIHLWCCPLSGAVECCAELGDHLAADERAKADRFRRPADATRYIATRGLLRHLLGSYLNADPRGLRFEYGPQGKPRLANGGALQFNVSHSGDLAVFAFAIGRALGVDVESRDRGANGEEIAYRFFSPAEQAELRSMPPAERPDAFISGWTRKEAFIKARGESILGGLARVTVSLRPTDLRPLRAVAGSREALGGWQLHTMAIDEQYLASVCWQGPADLSCRRLVSQPP